MKTKEHDEILFAEVTLEPGGCATMKAKNGGTPRLFNGEFDMSRGRVFRPLRLYLMGDLEGLLVEQVFVGSESHIANDWTIPATAFAEGKEDPGFRMASVAPEIDLSISIQNQTDRPLRVAAKLVGPSVCWDDPS
jgi:hypothetical protein